MFLFSCAYAYAYLFVLCLLHKSEPGYTQLQLYNKTLNYWSFETFVFVFPLILMFPLTSSWVTEILGKTKPTVSLGTSN